MYEYCDCLNFMTSYCRRYWTPCSISLQTASFIIHGGPFSLKNNDLGAVGDVAKLFSKFHADTKTSLWEF